MYVATAAMFSAFVILLSVDFLYLIDLKQGNLNLMEVDSLVGVSVQWRDTHYSLI